MLISVHRQQGMGLVDDSDMPAGFPTLVRQSIPVASNATVSSLEALYTPLSVPAELAWDWLTDIIFACNAYNLAAAYPDTTMRYIMSLPPATHGLDGYCELFHELHVTCLARWLPSLPPDAPFQS